MTTPIPGPPGLPLVGNSFDVDSQNLKASFDRLADIYGTCILLFEASQS